MASSSSPPGPATGRKESVLSYREQLGNIEPMTQGFGITGSDCIYDFRSFNWASAQLLGVLAPLCRGATLVMAKKRPSAPRRARPPGAGSNRPRGPVLPGRNGGQSSRIAAVNRHAGSLPRSIACHTDLTNQNSLSLSFRDTRRLPTRRRNADQRDRFDAHLSRCRRVNLGLHGGDDLLLGRRRHLVSSSKSKRGPAEPPAYSRV